MPELNRRFFDALMAEKKLSLRALAAKMGMNHSQLSLTFSGGRKLQLDEAAQLSQIFGVPIHAIVENAGVTVRPHGGKRVKVIGAVKGDGSVEVYPKDVVERTTAPAGLPGDAISMQCRTAGSALDWADGMLLFCRPPDRVHPEAIGRLSFCKVKDGPHVVAHVRRGYQDGSHNLSGFFQRESAVLEFATPILLLRP